MSSLLSRGSLKMLPINSSLRPNLQILSWRETDSASDLWRVVLSDGETSREFLIPKLRPEISPETMIHSIVNVTDFQVFRNGSLLIKDIKLLHSGEYVEEVLGSPREIISPRTMRIADLEETNSSWIIRARVIHKTRVHGWSREFSGGEWFSVTLQDESGEIRAIAFNEQQERFFPQLTLGSVFYFLNGSVREANQGFTPVINNLEIFFTENTKVFRCFDHQEIPQINWNFVPIGQILRTKGEGDFVDVIGICRGVVETKKITDSSGMKTLREVEIIGGDSERIVVTLWEEEGEEVAELENENPVLVVRGGRVKEYMGEVKVSVEHNSMLLINPDMEEARELRDFYEREF